VPHDDVDPFTKQIILRKARRLAGRAGFAPQDVEDLKQELTLRFFQRHPGLEPGDPRHHAFVTAVVHQCVANILRDHHAQKRAVREVGSLDAPVDAGEGDAVPSARTVSRRERDARLGVRPRDESDLAEARLDVAEVLAGLPPDLRDLAERLKGQSIAEVADDLGVARTSLYQSIRRLRCRFEKAGLKDYLQETPSSRLRTG
jgi:RNA polymerase sigma factor (sigma-70 family)